MRPKRNANIVPEPEDGFTPEEEDILAVLGDLALSELYGKLPTNRMKAIMALHFDCGYSQQTVAEIFGVTQGRIGAEIAEIRAILSGEKQRKLQKVTVVDVLSFIVHSD